jgi:NTE family protein
MQIGIVLSGGGARGIAHLGVMKGLFELDLYPTQLAGTSAGAIAGAMIAGGYSPDEVLDIILKTNLLKYFRPALSRMGLLKIDSAEALFKQYLPHNSFGDLRVPLTVAATDIKVGESVFYSEGELIKPLLASCCLPGIFEPVVFGQKTLVDGGVLNNLPVEAIQHPCDLLLGIHTNPYGEIPSVGSMRTVLQRSLYLAINNQTRQKFDQFDFVFEPPQMQAYDVFDLKKGREIYAVGYRYIKNKRAELKRILKEKTEQ